ncbi:MAG: glycosyltransferase family 2 protein [Candidatus Cyclobacteriaceae bacterium M2_1C_046]
MNEVAIVILNFNGAHYLTRFLPSVIQYSEGCRIIVADNCSTDNSIEILRKQFPEVQILQLEENYGFSKGYNVALQKVNAKYYVLLNSDVEVTEGWWQRPIELLQENNDIAAIQPKILSYHNKTEFEYAGAGGGYLDKYGYPFCRGRMFNTLEKDLGQYDNETQLFWATGACMFIKAEDFHNAGGFDPDFFAHMEEIDLCWRLQKMGKQIYYTGQSHVFHVGGGTLERSHPRKTYLNFRNGLSLLFKNYSGIKFLSVLPIRIVLDFIAIAKFTLTESPKHGLAVIKAHRDFLFSLKKNVFKRRAVRKMTVTKETNIYPRSVVFEYYLMKKKYFSELKWKMRI